jgi:cytochrome c-type biogenesis protein CcmH/NrfF
MARPIKRVWILVIVGLMFLVSLGAMSTLNAPRATAQQPSPDLMNHMERIAQGLYCPVCVGVPLNVCDTQACEQWRNLIIQKIQNGESDEQIRQYFIDQYGDRVLGAPPPEGFNLGAYVLPILILVGGAAILFFTMRGWLRFGSGSGLVRAPRGGDGTRVSPGAAATIPPVPPEYAERIARELKERDM